MYFDYPPPPPCEPCSCCKGTTSTTAGTAGTKTTDVDVQLAGYSTDKTHSGCVSIPLKSGGSLPLAWTRMPQPALDSAYADGWMPAGASGTFTFLPRVNLDSLPSSNGRRTFGEEGTISFDDNNVPQAELPLWPTRDTTYFTVYHRLDGVYFEYFAGSTLTAADKCFGRLNRRYDIRGNELLYHYGLNDSTNQNHLLRHITGDLGGNVSVYFYYTSELIPAPLTKIFVRNLDDDTQSRSVYFQYTTYSSNPYLSKITNPSGCVTQYDPIVPFADGNACYQIKREVDPEGYQTYFDYDAIHPNQLSRTTEPGGRITYYDYVSSSETRKTLLGRPQGTTLYSLGALSEHLPLITQKTDPLGNTSYFVYDPTLARITKQFDPNGNLTYFNYNDPGSSNQYAVLRQDSALNGAETNFGYATGSDSNPTYDVNKMTGPRHAVGYPVVTYYTYDNVLNRTSQIDPLGNVTRDGRDAQGRLIRQQDARGNTTYFNYGSSTGNLDSQSDAQGDVAYFRYNAFRDMVAQVSPRFADEGGFQAFATYFEYDSLGRRIKSIDPLQNVSYFDWTSRGDVLNQVDARGQVTANTYNGLRLLTQMTVTERDGTLLSSDQHGYDIYKNRIQSLDGRSNATYFFYDSIDRLTAQKDALQNLTYFFYDAVGNRTVQLDARLNPSYYFYDLLSRNTVARDALANSTYYFYDLANNRTHVLDARNNPSYFFYDQLDRVQATRDALGNPTYFRFDEVGNRICVQDGRFNTTYYNFDSVNRVSGTQDALGNKTYFFYDQSGNQTSVVNARTSVRFTMYDQLDRPMFSSDGAGNATLMAYDQVGNLSRIDRGVAGYGIQPYGTSPYGGADGVATYFFYGGLRRLNAVRDPMGATTYYTYDLTGNRTQARNPLQHTTYFGFDTLNRLSQVQDATNAVTYFEYDSVGNQTKVIDPDNHATQMRYDDVNRADAIRFADGGSVYFFYDPTGNRSRDLDARGNTTYYGYDQINRLTQIQDALGKTLYYEYDAVSNRTKFIDAEGANGTYTYDAVNRRTNTTFAVAGTVVSDGLRSDPYYVYDQVGNLSQMADLWGLHLFGYDGADKIVRHQYPSGSKVYFEYDRRNNTTARVYPGSSGSSLAAYNADDRQTQLMAPSGAGAYFTYDLASNQTWRKLGNGIQTYFTYDPAERLLNVRTVNKNLSPLTYFDYSRDSKGLITKAVREANYTTYYGYDQNDRLTSEIWASGSSEVYGYRYAYDFAGNRTRQRVNGQDTYFSYDQANQLTVKGTNALYTSPTYYTYDRCGSLTDLVEQTNTTKFAYNAAGLIARIKWKDASSTYFFYDGMLQRYAISTGGTTNYFLWDGLDLLQELNADGTLKEEHTHAKTPIAGIAQLVESYRPAQADQKIYPGMDPRGSITKYVKSDGTTVLASREYDAFGNLIPNSSSGTWPGRFGYQGEAWMEICSGDGVQRLILSPARIYDPAIGRFLSKDPLCFGNPADVGSFIYSASRKSILSALKQLRQQVYHRTLERRERSGPIAQQDSRVSHQSMYVYVSSNPMRSVDPEGLQEKPLKPEDFPVRPGPFAAETAVDLTWDTGRSQPRCWCENNTNWKCLAEWLEVSTKCAFNAASSYQQNPNTLRDNPALMTHEQGHMEICKRNAQSLRQTLWHLWGFGQGTTQAQARIQAESDLVQLTNAAGNGAVATMRAEQESYDEQTNHGTDIETQNGYNSYLGL